MDGIREDTTFASCDVNLDDVRSVGELAAKFFFASIMSGRLLQPVDTELYVAAAERIYPLYDKPYKRG